MIVEVVEVGAPLAGKYTVLKVVETREHRNVYVVRDSVYNRQWVLKQFSIPSEDDLKKEFLNHFYAEGDREASITLDLLPRVEEFFAEKGSAWTVTEQIGGRTLEEERLHRDGTLSEEVVRTWARAVAEAIRFLHAQEPRMVLGGFDREAFVIDERGNIRLTDYGIARIYPPAHRASLPADCLPRWYDSEMLANAKATRQADIWSLGALCYFLLTGVDARHEARKSLSSLRGDVSASFSGIVEKCLEPFAEYAYASIEEVLDALSGRGANERATPPRLAVHPQRLDLTSLSQGTIGFEHLKVLNEGGGTISGHVHSSVPWLQVSPQHFEGDGQEIQVWIDTSLLHEDIQAHAHILVTSANEEIRVPVTVALQLGRVGGLPPKVGAFLMLVIACIPLGLFGWYEAQAFQATAALVASRGGVPTPPLTDPAWLDLRAQGSLLLGARLAIAVLVPMLVYAAWQALAVGARRRTTAVAFVLMHLPALALLIAMRATETSLLASPLAVWLHLAPSIGAGLAVVATMVTTFMLMTPGSRYPLFFGQSYGLRVLLALVLLGLYGLNAWSLAVR